jgi:GxxExxY protein
MIEPSPEHDLVARQIVDAAFAVRSALGPGLLESVYEQCLGSELEAREIPFLRQVGLPVHYRNKRIDVGYRMDLVVADLLLSRSRRSRKSCRFMMLSCLPI